MSSKFSYPGWESVEKGQVQPFASLSAGHLSLHSLTTRFTVCYDENPTYGVDDPRGFSLHVFEAKRRLDNTIFVLLISPFRTSSPQGPCFHAQTR